MIEDLTPEYVAFRERLREAREQRGLTQQQVADRFGLCKQSVSAWELGRAMPNPMTLRAIKALYGVTSDWLLDGTEDPGQQARVGAMVRDQQEIETLNAAIKVLQTYVRRHIEEKK